jgi:hypothetical protein
MVKEITNYGELGKFYIPKEFNSQESLNVEKLDEMPDYETTDRVVAKDTRIPSNDNDKVIHPDSLFKKRTHRKCDDKYFDELNKDLKDS